MPAGAEGIHLGEVLLRAFQNETGLAQLFDILPAQQAEAEVFRNQRVPGPGPAPGSQRPAASVQPKYAYARVSTDDQTLPCTRGLQKARCRTLFKDAGLSGGHDEAPCLAPLFEETRTRCVYHARYVTVLRPVI